MAFSDVLSGTRHSRDNYEVCLVAEGVSDCWHRSNLSIHLILFVTHIIILCYALCNLADKNDESTRTSPYHAVVRSIYYQFSLSTQVYSSLRVMEGKLCVCVGGMGGV